MSVDIQIQLHEATSKCDFEGVKRLVSIGADVDVGNEYDTPLGSCIGDTWEIPAGKRVGDSAQLKIIEYLLGCGADPNLPAYGGHTPVALMGFHARPAALKLLLDRGGDPNRAHDETGETPLHLAAGQGFKAGASQCVRHLLAAGADPNVQTRIGVETDNFWRDICVIGETPLHRAAAYGDETMIRLLVESGADPSIKDGHDESPLTWFSRHQRDKPSIQMDAAAMRFLSYGKWKDRMPTFCKSDT